MDMTAKTYHIPFIESDKADEINWKEIPPAHIDVCVWTKDYTPKACCKAVVLGRNGRGEKIRFRLCCHEANPKAVYHNFFDEVYKDSCLEAFIGFEKGGKYMNCEMNSNGAALIAIGPNRNERTRIDEIIVPPTVKADVKEDRWNVTVEFTIDQLKKIFGDCASLDKGTHFYGNFYKCGDECETVHYLMWNPITAPEPDYHRPECFGDLIID